MPLGRARGDARHLRQGCADQHLNTGLLVLLHVDDQGRVLVGATTGTFGHGNADFCVIRTSADGEKLGARSHGSVGPGGKHGYDWLSALQPTEDGGAILVGHSGSNDIQDVHVARIAADGAEQWSTSFGRSPFHDYGSAVAVAADGRIIVAGVAKKIVNGPSVYDNQLPARCSTPRARP